MKLIFCPYRYIPLVPKCLYIFFQLSIIYVLFLSLQLLVSETYPTIMLSYACDDFVLSLSYFKQWSIKTTKPALWSV